MLGKHFNRLFLKFAPNGLRVVDAGHQYANFMTLGRTVDSDGIREACSTLHTDVALVDDAAFTDVSHIAEVGGLDDFNAIGSLEFGLFQNLNVDRGPCHGLAVFPSRFFGTIGFDNLKVAFTVEIDL